jgi:hypothetical protein
LALIQVLLHVVTTCSTKSAVETQLGVTMVLGGCHTCTIEYLVTSANQEELGQHIGGPHTPEGEIFCPMLMRENLEASRQPSAMTTSSTSTTVTTPIREVKICLHVKLYTRRSRRRRSAHREGPRLEMKIYTTGRSQRKDLHVEKLLEAKACVERS